MGYWDETDRILRKEGAPNCPRCGEKMFPEDDHGRFKCFCSSGKETPKIPQVKAENLSDKEKAKIPPLNRLNMPPTKGEKEWFTKTLQGDSEGAAKATKKINEERKDAKKK